MKTVILAGGLGTRIAEEGIKIPKPMVEIGGQPILWHIMKQYSYYGFNEFIICCGYMGNVIKNYFSNYYLYNSDITFDFSDQNAIHVHSNVAEPWKVTLVDTGPASQTGGRIKRIKKYVGDETFFITYGDGVSDIDLNKLLHYHKGNNKILTISTVQQGGRFGVLDFDSANNLVGFREKAKEDGSWINAGFMVAEPELFDYLNGDACVLETVPFQTISKEGKMSAYRHMGFWQCMDTYRDRVFLEQHWDTGNAPWKVWG